MEIRATWQKAILISHPDRHNNADGKRSCRANTCGSLDASAVACSFNNTLTSDLESTSVLFTCAVCQLTCDAASHEQGYARAGVNIAITASTRPLPSLMT